MFCPKCGIKNPDDGKFCRKCGTDLSSVSDALTGGATAYTESSKGKKKQKHSWESAMGKLFMGAAFLTISIVLGVTGAAGGHAWWYWMLIPAFSMIGAGVAQVLQITHGNDPARFASQPSNQIENREKASLPPKQTEFVPAESGEKYETGELVPPSVVENTTRHLEIDKEGNTMTLPKRD